MAHVSSPLIQLLTQKPTGSSSAFDPDYLYLLRCLRTWSSPIGGIGMRCGAASDGTVTLALISDQDGQPNEVLFKSELNLPNGKDAAASTSLISMVAEPLFAIETFWIGFRFSARVDVPLRLAAFVGNRTAAPMDYAQLTGSLLGTPMETIVNDEQLGMPILFPIYREDVWGVSRGD